MIAYEKTERGGISLPALVAMWLLLSLVLLFALVPRASAQVRGAHPPEAGPQVDGVRPPPPRRDVGGGLLLELNLTTEQRSQLREIRVQSDEQARALSRRLNAARRALDDTIYADAVDEAVIEQRVREVSEAQAALVRLRAQTELRVRRVLTPEQLQSFRELRQRARLRQRGRGRRGGRNPRAPRPGGPGEGQAPRLEEPAGTPAGAPSSIVRPSLRQP